MLRHVDLFAGTGGFSVALQATGRYQTIFANDLEPRSKQIYDLNHETKLTLGSLLDLELTAVPAMDILTAGFPCQPFSIAGQRKGFDDERANVFWKLLAILKHHHPATFILENVKNLVSHDQGRTFKVITSSLAEAGYFVKTKVLNTATVTTIPQNRERIYLVGFDTQERHDRFEFPPPDQKPVPVASLLEPVVSDDYYYSSRYACWDVVEAGVKRPVTTNAVYQFRRQYVRENKSGLCPTLTANMGGGGHNVPLIRDERGIRKLTPRECFNLQGFPSDYQLPAVCNSALYKLAGNAITVSVVRAVADALP